MKIKRINLSASMLRAYKSCPRLFELEYVEMLKPAIAPAYFTTGSDYHRCVEHILRGEDYEAADTIVDIMAGEFKQRIAPLINASEIEKEFDIALTPWCRMVGRIAPSAATGRP
ncbi:hypothetical protein FACS1894216_16270 [Synergistales bacterium]|nr:hypothetical protein FACS1894216_16270 [Synergistales bacterium]